MANELAKQQKCVLLRTNIEVWIDKEKADKLLGILNQTSQSKFIEFDNQVFNTSDIVGVFDPITIEEMHNFKRGWWKCDYKNWHTKYETCECGRMH
jgi:hypothetical protein